MTVAEWWVLHDFHVAQHSAVSRGGLAPLTAADVADLQRGLEEAIAKDGKP